MKEIFERGLGFAIDKEKQVVIEKLNLRILNFELLIFDCGFKKKNTRQRDIADFCNKTGCSERPYGLEPKLYFDRIYRIKTDG